MCYIKAALWQGRNFCLICRHGGICSKVRVCVCVQWHNEKFKGSAMKGPALGETENIIGVVPHVNMHKLSLTPASKQREWSKMAATICFGFDS
eukprot:1358246-Amphidinium_carterae.1